MSPIDKKREKLFFERVEDEYYVRIDHSMTKEHYISFVAAASSNAVQMVKGIDDKESGYDDSKERKALEKRLRCCLERKRQHCRTSMRITSCPYCKEDER